MNVEWSDAPSQRLRVGDAALEYACFGPSPDQAPTIVLLHEGLGCAALWRDLPQRLTAATGFGVLAYSRAGYGRSSTIERPRPLDYQTREATDVIGPVLDAVGVQRAVLMGHSDGATMAAIYAGSVSDMRVRALILMAPQFFMEAQGLDAIRASKSQYEQGDLKAKMTKYHDDPDAAFYGWHDAWVDPANSDWNVADCIDHLRIPVLAIQGCDDAFGTLDQISEIENRIYSPVETLILEGCGHAPHFEKPDEILHAVTDFCARLDRIENARVDIA
ncbi:MAG: pimeloyl-ACP methyl ester carboxylesterase [Ascidiaceihabitans sp.]|jgi:pimeloyl-ACP methyl ester carboxylesterase